MKNTAIVAFAFGNPSDVSANQVISKLTEKLALELDVPVITQRDIILPNLRNVVIVPEFHDSDGKSVPPSTFQVAQHAVSWAHENGVDGLWVIAAPPHKDRCIRDVYFLANPDGVNMIVRHYNEAENYPDSIWFSEKSHQWWTRSLTVWNIRENLLRLLPFSVYKRICE